ncbi:MAG TPA: universal stress protein [Gemmatimonadales bacterium]|nr:universal stress protein [Gemmatimonadales bacterium]
MFTSILVGLDGSQEAQVALAQAIIIGRRFHSRILIAHVSPPRGRTGEMALGAPWMEWTPATAPDNREELEEAAATMVADAAGAVRRAGLEAQTIMRTGVAFEVLRELAEEVGAVVVGRIGTRGSMAPPQPDTLGPDTRELIRRSPRPVLVSGPRPTEMDRILVAYAGGPVSEATLTFASRFAGITGAHLDVLHVATDAEAGRQLLARASSALSLAALDFETHFLEGELESAIPDAVRRLGSNAFFAGAHREEASWMVPSHMQVILRHTDIPVLIHMQPASAGARLSAAHRRSPY